MELTKENIEKALYQLLNDESQESIDHLLEDPHDYQAGCWDTNNHVNQQIVKLAETFGITLENPLDKGEHSIKENMPSIPRSEWSWWWKLRVPE
jgi:hypothetical protein